MIPSTLNPNIFIPFSLLFLISLFSSLPISSPYSTNNLTATFSPAFINHSIMSRATFSPRNKKLRRLPHVFSKVLQLPFDSDTDVYVEDRQDFLRFIAKEVDTKNIGGCVGVHVVEVHHGITKVVIRKSENRSQPSIDELDLNVWRFRLPPAARPELATAVYENGQLVVTVPKNGYGWGEGNNVLRGENCKREFKGNMGNLLLVQ